METAIFEQPLNERIRTFMRLQQVRGRLEYHIASDSEWDTHAAVLLVLDLYDLTSRLDLKSEVMKELERQSNSLAQFSGSSEIDNSQLSGVLNEQRGFISQLHEQKGQITQHIKNSEFLNNVRQRCAASGTACSYDLPVYHHWLSQSHATRQLALREWLAPFQTTLSAINLILDTIRLSNAFESTVAHEGFFQQSLNSMRPPQLIRVKVSGNHFPEISGSKHRMSVRFLQYLSMEEKTPQSTGDVRFDLALCTI